MSRIVYLIGVDHRLQRVGSLGIPPEVAAEFALTLKELAREHDIRGIAEEMSSDGLWHYTAAGGSLPFLVARELGLPHQYCDPPREIQSKLGIESDAQRERYWLGQLSSFTGYPCLFILGANHTTSFSSLLADSGFTANVLFHEWQPSTPLDQA